MKRTLLCVVYILLCLVTIQLLMFGRKQQLVLGFA